MLSMRIMRFSFGLLLLGVFLLSGCASIPPENRHPQDPFEPINRAVFEFNEAFDRTLLKPVAEAYSELPRPVRTGVGNFFSNLGDVIVMVNNALQGKFHAAASDLSRVMFNTSFGVFGLIDVATPMGLPKHHEDFGQTLGVWGVPAGPYLQVPFFGPSTLRDGPAFVVDVYAHPGTYIWRGQHRTYWSLFGLNMVRLRAGLLGTEELLDTISEDRYVALRQFWLQRREFLVRDGISDDSVWLDELDLLDELDALDELDVQEHQ